MVDRLRVLLEEPLDPHVGRAVVVLASAIVLGLAALFVLAPREPGTATKAEVPATPRSTSGRASAELGPAAVEGTAPRRRQDPQDQKGSPAARRAARALASHRALQHVPYRSGGLAVELVGARGHRALLRVSAPTARAARQGWSRFLRRYRDTGGAYVPRFEATEGRRSRGAAMSAAGSHGPEDRDG